MQNGVVSTTQIEESLHETIRARCTETLQNLIDQNKRLETRAKYYGEMPSQSDYLEFLASQNKSLEEAFDDIGYMAEEFQEAEQKIVELKTKSLELKTKSLELEIDEKTSLSVQVIRRN